MSDLSSERPFDDLRALMATLPQPDIEAMTAARSQLRARPIDLSGGEEGLAGLYLWLAGWQGAAEPSAKDIHLCLLASSYEGGATPDAVRDEVTRASKGRALVNPLCVTSGLGLRILELAPELPHDVVPDAPTWNERDCMATVAFGMETTAAGGDVIAVAGLAPGGELAAEALIATVLGMSLDGDAGALKARFKGGDPLEALRALGGRDTAAILGGLLAARSRRMPVLIEGWAGLAAAAVFKALVPAALDHVRLAALTDKRQSVYAEALGLSPLIGAVTAAGVGTGLALAGDLISAVTKLTAMPALPKT